MKVAMPDGKVYKATKCENCLCVAVIDKNEKKIVIGKVVTSAVECGNCGAFITEKPISTPEVKPRKRKKKESVKKRIIKYFSERKVVEQRSINFVLGNIVGRNIGAQDYSTFKSLDGEVYKKENCRKKGRGYVCDWVSLVYASRKSPELKEDVEYRRDLYE